MCSYSWYDIGAAGKVKHFCNSKGHMKKLKPKCNFLRFFIFMLTISVSISCTTNKPAESGEINSDTLSKIDSGTLELKKTKKYFYGALSKIDKSKFPLKKQYLHSNDSFFNSSNLPMVDSSEFTEGLNPTRYYSDNTYSKAFDCYIFYGDFEGDCGQSLSLMTTDKVDSVISSAALLQECSWENGNSKTYSSFSSDSTFTTITVFNDRSSDSLGNYSDYWNSQVLTIKYKIDSWGNIIELSRQEN